MIPKNRRHLCLCAAAVLFGILLSARPGKIWVFLCVLLAGACLWFVKKCENTREALAVGILLAALAAVSFCRCEYQTQQYQKITEKFPSGSSIRVWGTVCRKEIRETGSLYYLKHTTYYDHKKIYSGGRILLYAPDDSAPIGARVTAFGVGELFESAANEGNFDAAAYYRSQNITFRVFAKTISATGPAKISPGEWLYRLRKKMLAVYERLLDERDAGVLSAMALGSRSQLDDETKQLYQSSGISHILAISGLHISILGLGLFRFFRRLGCAHLPSAAAGTAAVLCFAVMSGFGVSARRAVIMYLFLAGAQVLGRTYDAPNALAAAAAVILLISPLALFQSGFLFSFTAVTAVLLTASALPAAEKQPEHEAKGAKKKRGKILSSFQQRCLMNLGIQMWLMPLTAFFYYEVPVFSLFLNLLVVPLCGWLLGFALIGGLLGTVCLFPARGLFVPCRLILDFYEVSMNIFRRLPGNPLLTGQPPVWLLFLYYLLLAVLAVAHFSSLNKPPAELYPQVPKSYRKQRKHRLPVRASAVCLLLVLCLHTPQKEQFRVDFLDVGQGDGICISSGSGYHAFLDGGSTSEDEVGKYRILPFLKYHRIGTIDVWFVSHADDDHISGLTELLNAGYPVKKLALAKAMPRDRAWEKLVAAADRAGTEVLYTEEGTVLDFGNGARMKCLYPAKVETAADRNALSQVWTLEYGDFSFLFTGDIGEEQEELLCRERLLSDTDVLKAAHHGSRNSSCEAFLEEVSPKLTVISCGKDNRYGHPHREALARIAAAGSRIAQTQKEGQITAAEQDGRIAVRYYRGSKE